MQIHCVKEVEQRGLGEVGIYRVPGYVHFQKKTVVNFHKLHNIRSYRIITNVIGSGYLLLLICLILLLIPPRRCMYCDYACLLVDRLVYYACVSVSVCFYDCFL